MLRFYPFPTPSSPLLPVFFRLSKISPRSRAFPISFLSLALPTFSLSLSETAFLISRSLATPGWLGSSRSSGPVVGSANFFLSYRDGGSTRCDAGLQSELIIACRKLRRGRARSYYTTRPRPCRVSRSLARASSSPSSEDRSRRATGPFPLVVPPSICTLSRARRH